METLWHMDAAWRTEPMLVAILATIAILTILALTFVAQTVALRARHRRMASRWAELEESWTEPLMAALEDPAHIEQLWNLVGDDDQLFFVNFVLRHVRRVSGEQREILRAIALPYLQTVADRMWWWEAEHRARAIQTLGNLGLPRFADVVVAALDDDSPLVALVAARSLAQKDNADYAPEVLARLHRFRTWSRSYLSSMLASMGPRAAPELRRALRDAKQPDWVRVVAADGLRELNDLPSADVASELLEGDAGRELKAAALRLLADIGREEHLAIVRPLAHAEDFVIRANALTVLGRLGGEAETPYLIGGMSDPSPWVAVHAARALRTTAGEMVLQDLAQSDHPGADAAQQVLLEQEAA